ncbi:MAG: hypothetical protein ACFFDN_16830 [Candidatus Hodarchaeota archaeon]
MKKIIIILSLICFFGCTIPESSTNTERRQTENAMKEAISQVGMPAIKNYQEKKLAKMIFELRDQERLITYAYIVNKMTGKLVFLGKCIGFGLPYSAQYTCPEKTYEYNGATLPQADPNGLYMPQGLSATWLMMIDPTTKKARPVYIEPEIVVSPFSLH